MRGRFLAIAVALATAACNPVSPQGSAGSNRACLADNPRFTEAWVCIRARLGSRPAAVARDGLIEEGDILADQVRTGKVKEVDARRRLSAGLAGVPD